MGDEETRNHGYRFALGPDERLEHYVSDQLYQLNLRHLPSSAANDQPVPVEIYAVDASGGARSPPTWMQDRG